MRKIFDIGNTYTISKLAAGQATMGPNFENVVITGCWKDRENRFGDDLQ